MKRAVKIWFTVAASLMLIGCAVFMGVMTMFKWDFKKLSGREYETSEHNIEDGFESIYVSSDTADVVFVPSDSCRVICYEEKNARHVVSVTDGILRIELDDNRKWYNYIGVGFGAPKVTVHLPSGEYESLTVKLSTGSTEIPKEFSFGSADISVTTGSVNFLSASCGDVSIRCSTGSINVGGLSAGSVTCKTTTGRISISGISCTGAVKADVSTGKVVLTDISCAELYSEGSTGKVYLKGVVASGGFNIKRSTGDVEFDGCDAAEIVIRTSTGDIEGSLLSEKVFSTKTDTGEVEVPRSTSGGKCELRTTTGDIEVEIGRK